MKYVFFPFDLTEFCIMDVWKMISNVPQKLMKITMLWPWTHARIHVGVM